MTRGGWGAAAPSSPPPAGSPEAAGGAFPPSTRPPPLTPAKEARSSVPVPRTHRWQRSPPPRSAAAYQPVLRPCPATGSLRRGGGGWASTARRAAQPPQRRTSAVHIPAAGGWRSGRSGRRRRARAGARPAPLPLLTRRERRPPRTAGRSAGRDRPLLAAAAAATPPVCRSVCSGEAAAAAGMRGERIRRPRGKRRASGCGRELPRARPPAPAPLPA